MQYKDMTPKQKVERQIQNIHKVIEEDYKDIQQFAKKICEDDRRHFISKGSYLIHKKCQKITAQEHKLVTLKEVLAMFPQD